ncbi:MAG: DUF2157 domain-containing protein [Bacteroidetes bacterium]|nr:DUF2157 domain-containing protein [Bacteroidota bacterium]
MQHTLRELLEQNLIENQDAERIQSLEQQSPFSLHWELKTLLYLGVILLNIGLGYLIYQNINHIGHVALITLIGGVCAFCMAYAIRHRQPFSRSETESPTPYYDYILLLGCLLFLVLEGYVQYQYNLFGTRYGLATFIPMVLFFGLAYWLDNRGVLSLGITALASWVGITVAPQEILSKNDFSSGAIVYTGVALGAFLSIVPFLSERLNFKKHFSLTYLNFGVHIGMISCLAGMMGLDREIVFFPLLCVAVGFFLWYARTRGSFYFLTVAVVYGYIGFTYLLVNHTASWHFDFMFYLLYFFLSCAGVIYFLIHYKRFIKNKQS